MFCSNKVKNFLGRNQNLSSKHLFYVCLIGMCIVFSTNANAQTPSLAEKVYEKYQTFFQREDIKELLPIVLVEIKKPDNQKLLTPETIELILDMPDLLKTFVPDIDDEFITLLKEDQEIQTFLRDSDVQTLLQDTVAIEELEALLEVNLLSLAERIIARYRGLFKREDIQKHLPTVLTEIKKPYIQKLLLPETIALVVEDPDLLKSFLPEIEDEFITLLKEDAEVKTFINDPDVQLLLQDPEAIDELEALLNVQPVINVIVRIVPASVESPQVGEQLVITVDIADAQGVSGYQGKVQFDPTALRYISLDHGTYLSGDVLPVATEVENNQVSFAQIAVGSTASMAEGTLVTITFEVLDAKASKLTLFGMLIGGLGGVSYPVTIENAEILAPPEKPWDVNMDGKVNILDLTFVASHFGSEDAPPAADVNRDGKVNILDLTLVASHFGE